MKKVIKLTEADLVQLIKKVINENTDIGDNCRRDIPYHKDHLKRATDWWRKWLNNSVTKSKFAKIFNYDSATVEKHFAHYNQILSQLKLEHVYDTSKPNAAWVKSSFLQNLRVTDGGYDIPITINCRTIGSYADIQSLMVHEIQHVLDSYHKFHPYKDEDDNIITFYSNMVKGALNKIDPKANEAAETLRVRKSLILNGFPKNEIDEMVLKYNLVLKQDEMHLKNPNELTSSLVQVRNSLSLKPGQQITKQLLIDRMGNNDVLMFIYQWLYSKQPLEKFLGYQNTIAMNNNKTGGATLA